MRRDPRIPCNLHPLRLTGSGRHTHATDPHCNQQRQSDTTTSRHGDPFRPLADHCSDSPRHSLWWSVQSLPGDRLPSPHASRASQESVDPNFCDRHSCFVSIRIADATAGLSSSASNLRPQQPEFRAMTTHSPSQPIAPASIFDSRAISDPLGSCGCVVRITHVASRSGSIHISVPVAPQCPYVFGPNRSPKFAL